MAGRSVHPFQAVGGKSAQIRPARTTCWGKNLGGPAALPSRPVLTGARVGGGPIRPDLPRRCANAPRTALRAPREALRLQNITRSGSNDGQYGPPVVRASPHSGRPLNGHTPLPTVLNPRRSFRTLSLAGVPPLSRQPPALLSLHPGLEGARSGGPWTGRCRFRAKGGPFGP